jgi:hypothetical protein
MPEAARARRRSAAAVLLGAFAAAVLVIALVPRGGSPASLLADSADIMKMLSGDSSVLSRYAVAKPPSHARARRQGALAMTRYGIEPQSWCGPDSPACHDMAGVADLGRSGQPTHDGLLGLAAKFPDLYKEAVARNGGDFKLAAKIAAEKSAHTRAAVAKAVAAEHKASAAPEHAAPHSAAPPQAARPDDRDVRQLATAAVAHAARRTAAARRRAAAAAREARAALAAEHSPAAARAEQLASSASLLREARDKPGTSKHALAALLADAAFDPAAARAAKKLEKMQREEDRFLSAARHAAAEVRAVEHKEAGARRTEAVERRTAREALGVEAALVRAARAKAVAARRALAAAKHAAAAKHVAAAKHAAAATAEPAAVAKPVAAPATPAAAAAATAEPAAVAKPVAAPATPAAAATAEPAGAAEAEQEQRAMEAEVPPPPSLLLLLPVSLQYTPSLPSSQVARVVRRALRPVEAAAAQVARRAHAAQLRDAREAAYREAYAPPPSRTKWTRRVPHPVLIGHAASLSQVRRRLPRRPQLGPRGPRRRARGAAPAREPAAAGSGSCGAARLG